MEEDKRKRRGAFNQEMEDEIKIENRRGLRPTTEQQGGVEEAERTFFDCFLDLLAIFVGVLCLLITINLGF